MAYSFDQIFAADPATTGNVAANSSVLIFAPGDTAKTPLTITTTDGQPLANPVPTNSNGFGPAFMHATLDRVAWEGGGFTGFFAAYEGMKNEAVSARTAAESAAADASAAAVADLNARIAAGEFKGADGSNVLPTDTAIRDAINNTASATHAALDAAYAQIGPQGLYVDAKLLAGATAAANASALNTAMTSAATFGATVFIPAGTYSINSVSITAPLRGAGRGATILNGVRLIFAAHNVSISALKLHSTDPVALSASGFNDLALTDVEVSHDLAVSAPLGFSATNVQRLRITGCKFGMGGVQFSTVNDFVYDGNYTDAQYLNVNEPLHISQQSSGVVTNSTFKNTLTDAIDLYSSGEYCVISNNRFYGLKGASGIECKVTMSDDVNNTSGPGNVIDGVVISNNILRDFIPQNAGSGRAGIYAEYVDSRATPTYAVADSNRALVITGNVLEDFNVNDPGFAASYNGIVFTGHNGMVTNNVIRNIRSWTAIPVGINLAWSTTAQKCAGVRVSGNIVAGVEDGYGIQTGNMDRCQISDNIIRQDDVSGRTTKHGLNILAGVTLNHCSIQNNTFSCNTSTSFGIRSTAATTTLSRCVIQGNVFKDCGVSIAVAQYCSFVGNSMDNGTNSQSFSVGVAGTSVRGNIYSGNHITMSADYALNLVDHDGFVVTGNTFNNTARAVLLNGATKNGIVDNNVSIVQTLGQEFPHYSGVIAGDQATISVGTNKVLP